MIEQDEIKNSDITRLIERAKEYPIIPYSKTSVSNIFSTESLWRGYEYYTYDNKYNLLIDSPIEPFGKIGDFTRILVNMIIHSGYIGYLLTDPSMVPTNINLPASLGILKGVGTDTPLGIYVTFKRDSISYGSYVPSNNSSFSLRQGVFHTFHFGHNREDLASFDDHLMNYYRSEYDMGVVRKMTIYSFVEEPIHEFTILFSPYGYITKLISYNGDFMEITPRITYHASFNEDKSLLSWTSFLTSEDPRDLFESKPKTRLDGVSCTYDGIDGYVINYTVKSKIVNKEEFYQYVLGIIEEYKIYILFLRGELSKYIGIKSIEDIIIGYYNTTSHPDLKDNLIRTEKLFSREREDRVIIKMHF